MMISTIIIVSMIMIFLIRNNQNHIQSKETVIIKSDMKAKINHNDKINNNDKMNNNGIIINNGGNLKQWYKQQH